MRGRRAIVWTFLVFFATTLSGHAQQQVAQIYSANEWNNSLQLVNFQTRQVVNLCGTLPKPDDLTINSAGQLIYSLPNSGTVDLYDPSTGINTVLVSGIGGARDLTVEPGGQTLLISKYGDPAEILRYSFATNTASVFFPKTKGITAFDGTAYDAYGNLYAVASHNTIIQIDPVTGAIVNTLVTQPHNGINGGDGLTYDSFTNSLWTPNNGKTSPLGVGLIQIPVQPSGFGSTPPGFIFYPLNVVGMDGIKSDGNGNLYIGAIHTAFVYNIPAGAITYSVVTKGADGVALVPGTY